MQIGILMAATVMAITAHAQERSDVAICVTPDRAIDMTTIKAAGMASEMFVAAGVKIDWRLDPRSCSTAPSGAIFIRMAEETPRDRHPGALAFALPYRKERITVFYDRVRRFQAREVVRLLAHVLVHEITHVLQGVSRHSDQGVMKPRWETSDFLSNTDKPIPFASGDVTLIRLGLAARSARLARAKTD